MNTVLVTGADGFIGKVLVRKLKKSGYEVISVTRGVGDVTKPETFRDLPPASVVFHLAGRSFVPDSWSQADDFIRVNVLGTQNVLDYCQKYGARLVFASTYVYGQPKRLPVDEDHPVQPNNPYALSKYFAEQLCHFAATHYKLSGAILRIFNVIGPGQRSANLLPILVQQVRQGHEISVRDLDPRRDYVYVDDVVEALISAGEIEAGLNVFNIGSGRSYSVAELIDALQTAAGTQLPVVCENEYRHQEIPDVVADYTRARVVMGWTPQWSLQESLIEMLGRESDK